MRDVQEERVLGRRTRERVKRGKGERRVKEGIMTESNTVGERGSTMKSLCLAARAYWIYSCKLASPPMHTFHLVMSCSHYKQQEHKQKNIKKMKCLQLSALPNN